MTWYEEAFTPDYDRIYFHLFTEERNTTEVDLIESSLNVTPDAELLDLACGHGRHALILAERGYRITGIDLSPRFIEMARAEAQRRKIQAHFEVHDMRELPYQNRFEGIYCYFTSFGYFSNRENAQVVEQVSAALRKQGRFLLETVNRDFVLHRLEAQARRWEKIDSDFIYLEESSFNARTSRVHTHRIILDGSARRELDFDLRLYSLSELEELIESNGMKVVAAYGDRDQSPFSVSSRRMIIVSEKL